MNQTRGNNSNSDKEMYSMAEEELARLRRQVINLIVFHIILNLTVMFGTIWEKLSIITNLIIFYIF